MADPTQDKQEGGSVVSTWTATEQTDRHRAHGASKPTRPRCPLQLPVEAGALQNRSGPAGAMFPAQISATSEW